MISRAIMVAAGSVTHRVIVFGNQHHGDSHHDFIGNRVEEGAKTGALIPATSEETIKPVGYAATKKISAQANGAQLKGR